MTIIEKTIYEMDKETDMIVGGVFVGIGLGIIITYLKLTIGQNINEALIVGLIEAFIGIFIIYFSKETKNGK